MTHDDFAKIDARTREVYLAAGFALRGWELSLIVPPQAGEVGTFGDYALVKRLGVFESLLDCLRFCGAITLTGKIEITAQLSECTKSGDNWEGVPRLPCPHGIVGKVSAGHVVRGSLGELCNSDDEFTVQRALGCAIEDHVLEPLAS